LLFADADGGTGGGTEGNGMLAKTLESMEFNEESFIAEIEDEDGSR